MYSFSDLITPLRFATDPLTESPSPFWTSAGLAILFGKSA